MPFRDVFNSIFFVSIGMLLSVGFLLANLSEVLLWFGALLIGKAMIVLAVALLLGLSLRISVMVGLGLAQVGEFSFILAKAGTEQGLLGGDDYQRFLAAAILSMMVTPFLIKAAPRVGVALQKRLAPRSQREEISGEFEPEARRLTDHVIIVGYGTNGQNLAKVLHRVGISYLVLELNADAVQTARRQGVPIIYGDAVRREVLQHVGVAKARVMVIAISDRVATRHVIALAREVNPLLHIIVRTRYMSEVADLSELGASQVVPEEFETSIEIFARVLREYGVSRNVIAREVEEVRSSSYQMLRDSSLPLAELDKIAEAYASSSSETLFISEKSAGVGKTLKELDLRRKTGATVTAAVRNGDTEINLGPQFRLAPDDILVLLGKPDEIERAVAWIERNV
jgi:CPA2 family monovalent cation:H+ antiporter-2